ncbi:DUF938 domain-containing protein [Alkalimonas sp. MEB108]|uniref:DUF938 domain-containing protein n=1 Tax=Alkalimonas cellulosilytica TaxID=3058395 RepID=A0ABU7J5V1_9GAMM|nr:DUF938 domain-containing protein [Alkalimonas sp. MEB108]MEE2001387.1 DUF938 domain-containing protein [Alkalimonas sp. MEB108]
MQTALPFSQACENNKGPILQILRHAFAKRQQVLEIGSGTGQHAEYFACELPHLHWQCSDQPAYLPDLNRRLQQAKRPNLPPAVALDIREHHWPYAKVDAVFSANTLHIMSWAVVQQLFTRLDELCLSAASLCIYGPFNYQGKFTSASNQAFDQSLRLRDPAMGIRDQEAVVALATQAGFALMADHAMPANNRLLHFQR